MSLYGIHTDDPNALRTAYAEVELVGPRQALLNRLARMRENSDAPRSREGAARSEAQRRAERIAAIILSARPYSNRRREIVRQVLDANPGVTLADLRSSSRLQAHVRVRQHAMRRLHAELGISTTEIGNIFNKDHTTVMYAIRGDRRKATR